jgi:YVTN family beta-propeller protein
MDHRGRFFYVVNEGSDDVTVFTIDPESGAPIHVATVAVGDAPTSIALSPRGTHAYTANAGSDNISILVVNAETGLLTPAGTIPAGTSPNCVAVARVSSSP